MNWFLIALIPPILYAAGNYLDKILLTKRLRGGGVGTIVIFSCFLGALILPGIYLFEPGVATIDMRTALILMSNGVLSVLAVITYLYVIEHDDISEVVPILQLTPVFGFFTGYVFLGEVLTFYQTVGSAIIVIGAIITSFDINTEGKFSIKKRVVALAVASAFIFSLSGTIFKFFATEGGYWKTQFWEYVGIMIVGIVLFVIIPNYRQNFIDLFRGNKATAIGLNILTEVVMVTADLMMNLATLLAPIVLIYVVNSFQPVFVFVLGIMITFFFPHIISESLSRKHLIQKVLTISIMVLGLLMLYW